MLAGKALRSGSHKARGGKSPDSAAWHLTNMRAGDRVAVYSTFEAFDVTPLLRLRDHPLRVTPPSWLATTVAFVSLLWWG